jgi:hypothetical protein
MQIKCKNCVVKHIGQALVCSLEVENGYPEHLLKVIGHLAEAENECSNEDLRNTIRSMRLVCMDAQKEPTTLAWEQLIPAVIEHWTKNTDFKTVTKEPNDWVNVEGKFLSYKYNNGTVLYVVITGQKYTGNHLYQLTNEFRHEGFTIRSYSHPEIYESNIAYVRGNDESRNNDVLEMSHSQFTGFQKAVREYNKRMEV